MTLVGFINAVVAICLAIFSIWYGNKQLSKCTDNIGVISLIGGLVVLFVGIVVIIMNIKGIHFL